METLIVLALVVVALILVVKRRMRASSHQDVPTTGSKKTDTREGRGPRHPQT